MSESLKKYKKEKNIAAGCIKTNARSFLVILIQNNLDYIHN